MKTSIAHLIRVAGTTFLLGGFVVVPIVTLAGLSS